MSEEANEIINSQECRSIAGWVGRITMSCIDYTTKIAAYLIQSSVIHLSSDWFLNTMMIYGYLEIDVMKTKKVVIGKDRVRYAGKLTMTDQWEGEMVDSYKC